MKKEFIPYEQALELKELGFGELCLFYYADNEALRIYHQSEIYDDLVGAPLYQQAFRWFREKYDLIGLIHIGSQEFSFSVYKNGHRITPLKEYLNYNGTYEEAENACMKKLIEIVKNKNHDTSTKKSR